MLHIINPPITYFRTVCCSPDEISVWTFGRHLEELRIRPLESVRKDYQKNLPRHKVNKDFNYALYKSNPEICPGEIGVVYTWTSKEPHWLVISPFDLERHAIVRRMKSDKPKSV